MSYLEFNPIVLLGTMFLFAVVAILMLLAPLLIGWLLRPKQPNPEKRAIYECGEPTIGANQGQFDLRFYVVALLFIVFDVEVAFFFPWAVVFGKANTLGNILTPVEARAHVSAAMQSDPAAPMVTVEAARLFKKIAAVDLLVFFGVVLVGFAYVWSRGDLDWVRSVQRQRAVDRSLEDAASARMAMPPPAPALR